jgi:DNA-binding MarR family transcriptional regulator
MFVQIAGSALRMESNTFRRHLDDPRFRAALGDYSASAFITVGQLAGCVAFHSAEHRLARWLLMVRDCVDRTTFPLTQEFIGVMLGVHRPTVTIAVRTLERAGLIEHRRGSVNILDGAGLEQAACECYAVIRAMESHRPNSLLDGLVTV